MASGDGDDTHEAQQNTQSTAHAKATTKATTNNGEPEDTRWWGTELPVITRWSPTTVIETFGVIVRMCVFVSTITTTTTPTTTTHHHPHHHHDL